jgi:hypothetical protein
MMPGMRALGMILAVVACVGCKGGSGDKAGSGAAAPPGAGAATPAGSAAPAEAGSAADGTGGCDVQVKGAVTVADHGSGGPAAIGTDYWMTEATIRRGLGALEKDPAKVDEQMKKDPRFVTLVLNCRGQHVQLSFMPGNDSKYADVPFGPKKYAIASDADAKPGEMIAILLVDHHGYHVTGGTVDVTRFDGGGLDATFEIPAEARAKDGGTIDVTGAIHLPCPPAYDKCTH